GSPRESDHEEIGSCPPALPAAEPDRRLLVPPASRALFGEPVRAAASGRPRVLSRQQRQAGLVPPLAARPPAGGCSVQPSRAPAGPPCQQRFAGAGPGHNSPERRALHRTAAAPARLPDREWPGGPGADCPAKPLPLLLEAERDRSG